jgi:site-specific recombinase XerD
LRTFFRYIVKTAYPEKYHGIDYGEIPFSDVTDEIVTGIRSDDVYEYLAYVQASRDNQSAARARKMSCLRSFYKYLTKVKCAMTENPTERIDSVQIKKTLPKYLTLEQSHLLLDSISGKNAERDYAIIILFLNCGFRVSELAGINLSDFSEGFESVIVTGKGSKQRILYLNEACRTAIKSYLKVRPENAKLSSKDALFVSRNRNRLSVQMIQTMIYNRLSAAGLGHLKLSVHKLRHTAATLMYQHGNVDVRVLKDILGHEQMSTTQIYTHLSTEQIKNAVNANPLSRETRKINVRELSDYNTDSEETED